MLFKLLAAYANHGRSLKWLLPVGVIILSACSTPVAKPGDTDTVKPVDTDTVKPVDTGAVKLVDTDTVKPVDTGAVKLVDTAAVKPVDTAAVKTVDTAAVKTVDTGAVKTVDTAAVKLVDTAAVAKTAVASKPLQAKPVAGAEVKYVDSVAFWLGEAGWAFNQDRLTTPKGDNAYYYLQRVLVLEPQHPHVAQAMEQIVLRYYELLQTSLKQGKVEQARVFLSRAQKLLPGHHQMASMLALINAFEAVQKPAKAAAIATKTPQLRVQTLSLTAKLLTQKSDALVVWLTALAIKAQALDATMLIVAPKDAQARWLYQTMNAANPEQRIRANIKRGTPSRIEVSYKARSDELEVYPQ
jgi:hypothetical protein